MTPAPAGTPQADHLFLSPHLDDAVLSCGGTIHGLCEAGHSVLVATVCAGMPESVELSPYAVELHERWGEAAVSPEQMVALRRKEDSVALASLGASWLHLDVLDAPYRRDPESRTWLYVGDDAIFGHIAPGDLPLVSRVSALLGGLTDVSKNATIYAPLAVGNHVDHQLVRRAAESWVGGGAPLLYYEDFPYAADDTAVRQTIDPQSGRQQRPRRMQLRPRLVPLALANLDAKVEAVKAYASQISTFWTDADIMEAALRRFAARRGAQGPPSERLWVPAGGAADASPARAPSTP
jgi:LmbE family N-acetylglucosaminyl deacetylase